MSTHPRIIRVRFISSYRRTTDIGYTLADGRTGRIETYWDHSINTYFVADEFAEDVVSTYVAQRAAEYERWIADRKRAGTPLTGDWADNVEARTKVVIDSDTWRMAVYPHEWLELHPDADPATVEPFLGYVPVR